MAQPRFPIRRISESEMRERFNRIDFAARLGAGELVEQPIDDRHPSLTAANEPFCTRSQMISYRDHQNVEIARVHQYLRPDGSIGASGRPDPKRVLEDGILYRLIKKRNLQEATQEQMPSAEPDSKIPEGQD